MNVPPPVFARKRIAAQARPMKLNLRSKLIGGNNGGILKKGKPRPLHSIHYA